MRGRVLFAALFLVLSAAFDALGEEMTSEPKARPALLAEQKQKSAVPGAVPAPQPSMVSIEQAFYLIRSTLLTLNDANRSGNYSVLRELAAPEFQARNTAADLALNFSDLRRRKFDLFAAAMLAPRLTTVPAIDADRRLHLAGIFETRPLQIHFDLTYQVASGEWRLFGITIATPLAPPVPPAPQPQVQSPDKPASPSIFEQRDMFLPKQP